MILTGSQARAIGALARTQTDELVVEETNLDNIVSVQQLEGKLFLVRSEGKVMEWCGSVIDEGGKQ